MGTRSTIKFYESDSIEGTENFLCAVYQQFDGYPEGVGKQIKDFIQSGKFVNGIPFELKEKLFNGMGCFVAQFIAEHKEGSGGLYITNKSDKQEYNYKVVGIHSTNFINRIKANLINRIKVECKEEKSYDEIIKVN